MSDRPTARTTPNGWLARFKEWGWDARIETYEVLFPTPKERLLEMVAPTAFKAALREPPLAVDPTSGQTEEQLPGYNAYSIDGDVTGPLVYVNYGRPSDYEELERRGISVKGAIVIARYGASWRGIKPKVAAEHGAVGCLIYSDPADDGYAVDDVFPQGPMRNRDGVQRGSVFDMPTHPGDPLTPCTRRVAGRQAARASADAPTLTRIPVLPISYGDAQPLLAALAGPIVPAAGAAACRSRITIGPGPARVHLKVAFNWDIKPLYNVVARLAGSTFPDEWIVRGNHHDAWVNGAQDPVSGMAPELEEARALGELVQAAGGAPSGDRLHRLGRRGARPARIDRVGRAPRGRAAAESRRLHQHRRQRPWSAQRRRIAPARDVHQPGCARRGGPRRRRQRLEAVAVDESSRPAPPRSGMPRAIAPTSGSRRSGRGRTTRRFSSTSATPTLNLGFGGIDEDGIYHSIYDDFFHFTKFLDTDFRYGRALAQTVGTAVIRLADADLLPFEFTNLADAVQHYLTEVQQLLKTAAGSDCGAQPSDSKTACSPRSRIRAGRSRRHGRAAAAGDQFRAARERVPLPRASSRALQEGGRDGAPARGRPRRRPASGQRAA